MTEYLSGPVLTRLAECRTIKRDLPELVNAMWRHYKDEKKDLEGFTKEDALVAVLEWLDCNNNDFDLTREEYDSLKEE